MEKILKLYYVEGGVTAPFPNSDGQVEIGAFRYDAKRMGGAPTITASVNYPSCLDEVWTEDVYAEFNGEKYFLKQTPTSSYNNESTMYKHDLELVSERVILDNVYFFDAVVGDPQENDKPVSNSTKVVFFGDVREFASRLQSSLEYSGLDYTVAVDDDVTSEEKLMSFEDQFFSNVLQEIYNTYEIPYYFEGKTIRIGYSRAGVTVPEFSYGVDDALLSITKNNANYKIVNRATATGSSENIPFYYPNNSPKGEIRADSSRSGLVVKVINGEDFSNNVKIGGEVRYDALSLSAEGMLYNGESFASGSTANIPDLTGGATATFEFPFTAHNAGTFYLDLDCEIDNIRSPHVYQELPLDTVGYKINIRRYNVRRGEMDVVVKSVESGRISVPIDRADDFIIYIDILLAVKRGDTNVSCDLTLTYENENASGWFYDGKEVTLQQLGLAVASGTPASGDTITQTLVEYINTSQTLLPYKYRETKGAERFYNATNGTYEGVTFNNPFVEGHPKEHIFTVENIKPSIEGMEYNGQRIDMFEAFAYDRDDNDETYEDEDGNVYFKHPYFFAKLKPLGFNLFDHAIEQQPMTISFTSGNCGACNFEIAVDEETQKNTVQVDENGDLVYDENGMVLCGTEGSGQGLVQFQDIQQDTTNNSVWIALRKEEDTYGILMPKAPVDGVGGHRPTSEDTFVILGINLPYEYIIYAEKKVEAEIIKYLQDNNDEKFTFSINLSRIYFAENEAVLENLSENSKIAVIYNGNRYELYVSSFSYSMSEGDALPEIRIDLDDTLKVSQNALQNAISQVKSELGRSIRAIDVVGASEPYFIRKDADDEVRGRPNFLKGVKFGEGGKVDILDNNSAKLTIEYLEVTKKATFTSLEIQEKTHVGGQILVTPASINCGEVEEFDDYYRCYFQTKGEDGDEIFNQFVVGDQAICQTFNAWQSKYYWRLVTGVGEDYIDLSKTVCDTDSDIPSAGDRIIQLGSQTETRRQNAIVIAAYGEGSPYIIQYKGINSFDVGDDKIVTKLSSTENIFTGKVHMELGSDGLDQLPEWIEVRDTANEALEKAGSIGEEAFAELEAYIDNVRQELQDQIDGAVDSYFEDYEPTTSNFPANAWQTEAEKDAHLNDTFTNLSDGRSWRWSKSAGVYTWVEIADTATSEALKLAGEANREARNKIRMFVEQPYPPYSVGDLWSRGEEAPLMRCINAKETGTFDEADWGLADNSQSYTDDAISNIKVGGDNLLRNSGFTGDYLSEQLADETVLEAAAQLYSSPLDHWTATSVTVRDLEISMSGKQVYSASGRLYQALAYKVFANEEYIVSFSAKGTSARFTIGGTTKEVTFTDEYARYEIPIIPLATNNSFTVQFGGFIYDLKLEKGNKATAWSPSPLDNASDRAYYQSLKYLSEAMEKGSTDVFGGLILTNTILLGNPSSNPLESNTAGVNGITTDSADDVAFWAGGTFDQANDTVMAYAENPRYQPTAAELANLAKAVITHGGRAILNDIILRGTVYADDGVFAGFIKKRATHITDENIDIIAPANSENDYRTVSIQTVGSIMHIETTSGAQITFELPILFKGVVYDTGNSGYTANDLREMIGSEILVYNHSSSMCRFCGYGVGTNLSGNQSTVLLCFSEGLMNGAGTFCRAKCVLSKDEDGCEMITWEFENGTFIE